MANQIRLGTNRTGLQASPMDADELIEGLSMQDGRMPRPKVTAEDIRADYERHAEPVGSMPPPATLKGMAGTVVETLTGNRLHILLDKLGQRAAYERTGTRLYDAMLARAARETLPEGMTLEALQEIRDDEASHFLLLTEAIEALGGDPTVQTPCADLSGVQGMGLVQAINEPRTTLSQALETLLAAELIDQASWELLIVLADQLGHDDWSARFSAALQTENAHLERVRAWLTASLESDAALLG